MPSAVLLSCVSGRQLLGRLPLQSRPAGVRAALDMAPWACIPDTALDK